MESLRRRVEAPAEGARGEGALWTCGTCVESSRLGGGGCVMVVPGTAPRGERHVIPLPVELKPPV